MRCPNEGSIQAYIDGELNEIEMKEIKNHLLQCEGCRKLYEDLKLTDEFVFEKMNNYSKGYRNNENVIKSISVQNHIKKKGEYSFMKKYKKVIVAASLGVVLTSCITVTPIRAAIGNAVSIFRANDIKSINVTLDDMKKLQKNIESHTANIEIDNIGKVTQEGGEQKTVTMEEAKKEVDFNIVVPESIKNINNVSLEKKTKIDLTLNVENINQLVKSLGSKKVFPKELDGKTFSLTLPTSLNFEYNDVSSIKYVRISESKIPEITGPSEENINEVVSVLSELPILPQNIQNQLKSITDWKSTLYVPNVENYVEEVNLNGIKAFGHFQNDGQHKNSSILFLKDGVLVGINGNIDKDEIIEIAKSMR